MNTFLVCKGLGGGRVIFHTWWRQQSNIKGGVINSAGHCFMSKDFVPTNKS